jgi:hypothetical protein
MTPGVDGDAIIAAAATGPVNVPGPSLLRPGLPAATVPIESGG